MNPRRLWALATGAGIVALVLALIDSDRSYNYDEAITVHNFVDAPIEAPLASQIVANNHPLFSLLEQLPWRLGLRSEVGMRLLPALFFAATVVLVVWWCARRWGPLAAVVAGVVVATNPLLLDQARQARGYTLLTLFAVASTILLPTRHRAAYVGLIAAGIATHLFFVIVLAAHVGWVLARRRLDAGWLARWAVGCVLGVSLVLAAFPARRPGVFQPNFPIDAARALFGPTAVVLLVSLGLFVWHRRDLWPTFALPAAALLVVWVVMQPLDLYPRFLAPAVPLAAVAAGWCTSRVRWAAVPVLAVALLALPSIDHSGIRRAAELVEAAQRDGLVVCGHDVDVLNVYLAEPVAPTAGPCDLEVAVGSWPPPGNGVERRVGDVRLWSSPRAPIVEAP